MLGHLSNDGQQTWFAPPLTTMCNPDHPLCRLRARLDWTALELEFEGLYADGGRPSIPLRVMLGLLMLAEMYHQSDERAVAWCRDSHYWQYFCGFENIQMSEPCHWTELGKFRKRIGADGVQKILAWTISAHQKAGGLQTKTVIIDSSSAEKAVTTPRDHKLYRRIAEMILAFSSAEHIKLRRSYRRVMRNQIMQLRTRNFPRAKKQARRATRRLHTIAGALLRDFQRKCSHDQRMRYSEQLVLMQRILDQGNGGPEHIYSLHEPQTYCMAKGKDHKQFEFGTKVTIAIDPHSGVIVSAMNHARNIHDSHVMSEVSENIEDNTGGKPKTLIGDYGYRDWKAQSSLAIDGISVITPDDLRRSVKGTSMHRRIRRQLRMRSRIEPVIGHLKSDHRLGRNYLRGWLGDEQNVLLAAIGWNLRKLLRFLWLILHVLRDHLRLAVQPIHGAPPLGMAA